MKGLKGKKNGTEILRLLKLAERAGWRLEERKSGITMVYPADGSQAFAVHCTYGSPAALRNVTRLFTRAGLDVSPEAYKRAKKRSAGSGRAVGAGR